MSEQLGVGSHLVAVDRSEERILLEEAHHRAANEASAALACLHLLRSAGSGEGRLHLIELAIGRLEAFGTTSRLFAEPLRGLVDVGALLERLVRSMLSCRADGGPSRVVLDLANVRASGDVARRVAMVAYELVTNAQKHAFANGGGRLAVRLAQDGGDLELCVADDGPGSTAKDGPSPSGRSLGAGILGALVERGRGRLERSADPDGCVVWVRFPLQAGGSRDAWPA